MITFYLLLLLASYSLSDNEPKEERLEEYCQDESFRPQCLTNEVIVTQSASYGRMRIGRCVTAEEMIKLDVRSRDDPSYLGCFADVFHIVNRHCSGKRTCELRVTDPELYRTVTPCSPALKLYLETSYSCISVVDDDRSCSLTASSNPTNIISSSVSKIGCGSKNQPWILEAPVGQHIQLSLLDLSSWSAGKSFVKEEQFCIDYGFIAEKTTRKEISICNDGSRQEKDLYVSRGNSLAVTFDKLELHQSKGENISFLIKVQTVGCSDIVPPEDTWLKRNDDVIVVGCYSSRQTWQLRCEGRKWIGVLGNCSQTPFVAKSTGEQIDKPAMAWEQEVLVIVAIGGFGLALCLVIICSGVVCLRRYYHQNGNRQQLKTHLLYSQNETEQRRIKLAAEQDHVTGREMNRPMPNNLTTSTLNGYPNGSSSHPPSYSMYRDGSDVEGRNGSYNDVERADNSVKYFVLEQDATA